jgi:hypothetical protein
MNPLDLLFNQVRGAIEEHGSPNTPGPSYDTGGILGQLAGLFGQHASSNGVDFNPGDYGGGGQFGNVQSSNNDPYGDPGAQGGQNASYGGGGQFGNVQSSNNDPYGDPGAR